MFRFKREFIEEAFALYPTWDRLHAAIHNHSMIVGRYLCDASQPNGIHYKEVLSATSLEELKEKAMILKRKDELYQSYMDHTCYEEYDPTLL